MKVWRPSASALQRSLNCESSCVLERPPEAPREHNAPSEKGNRIHRALQLHRYGARWIDVLHQMLPTDCPELDLVVKELPKVEPLMGLPVAEVECWMDPQTQEAELGVAGTPTPPGWYRGMADVIGECEYDGAKMPCVMDYKTGSPRHQVGADSAQLAYFVLWLHIKTGAPQIASIVFLTRDATEPRLHIWTKEEIDAFAQRFAELAAKLDMVEADAATPTLEKNKDCFFCPCRSVCPLWQQSTKESPVVAAERLPGTESIVAALTPDAQTIPLGDQTQSTNETAARLREAEEYVQSVQRLQDDGHTAADTTPFTKPVESEVKKK